MIRIRAAIVGLVVGAVWAVTLVAGDWSRHTDPSSGVGVDIPPGYRHDGPAREGPGVQFRADNGRSTIEVWGSPLRQARFSLETGGRIGADEADGWAITYRSETPDWAAWTATRAGHVRYVRTILTCNDTRTASVRLTYPAPDIPRFDAIADRLGRTLRQDGAC